MDAARSLFRRPNNQANLSYPIRASSGIIQNPLGYLRRKRGGMRVRPGVELAGLSDVGCQRENNEDRYSYWEPASDSEFPMKGRLAIVADGMGGYEGGQEASRIAVEVIEDVYANAGARRPARLAPARLSGRAPSHSGIAAKYPDFQGMGPPARPWPCSTISSILPT